MASAWSQLDQLLTCAICLDRYRNPKLLPCQHTFCMEPCLDGLIDYARRQIKCPECRAEHRIPFKGIQEFPTNVTLMRFLELHRDITGEEPEPPPSMMERCSVCSEKANLERCAHCDKKICPDCKEAHVDILRREINRINNQVRRGLHRLSDALAQTKKNADKLQENCSQVRDEIEDIVRRYSKDLKHTEEKLKRDLEMYTESELKAINKLKEDLEAEVSNMSSNCDLVEEHIKDDNEWTDAELLEYKDIFLKTLDFLRSFDTDNSDFSRRIKFQPRADPDVLHRNIADFGELKINAPPSCIPAQQSLAPPTSNALMRSQSDHRLAAQFARRTEGRSFTDRYSGHTSDNEREPGRPTSPLYGRSRRDTDSSGYRRYSERNRDYDYDRPSSRYIREESSVLSSRWRDSDEYSHRSRYNRDYEDLDSEPQHSSSRTVRFADEQPRRERMFDVEATTRGPLSGVIKLIDSPKVLERIHQNKVRQKQQPGDKDSQTPSVDVKPQTPATPPAPPRRPASRQQSEDDIEKQKKANQQQASSSSSANTQQTATSRPEQAPRSLTPAKTSSDTARFQVTNRAQRKESAEQPTETPAAPEREAETATRSTNQTLSVTETSEETDSSTSGSSSDSSCSRPTVGKALTLDGVESTAAPSSLLDKKPLFNPVPLTSQVKRNERTHAESERNAAEDDPRPVQSSFFSRQRRLPDPEPSLLAGSDDDDDDDEEEEEEEGGGAEESESSEESEEEEEDDEESDDKEEPAATYTTKATTSVAPATSAMKSDVASKAEAAESDSEESSTESSSSESSSEDSDAAGEESQPASSKDAKNNSVLSNDVFGTTPNSYSSSRPNYNEDVADDSEDVAELEISSMNRKPDLSVRRYSDPSGPNFAESNGPRHRRRSDDLETTDSSSGSSSTTYQSLSNTTPVLSNGTVDASENCNGRRESSRFGRRRPFLARSKSSHEIGLGVEATEDVEDEEEDSGDVDQSNYNHRSRSGRMSEDNISVPKSRPKLGSISSDHYTSLDSSTSSNSSWAKYLKNKYGSSATAKVVPRSRSSHALYQRSDSESSEDEGVSSSVLSSPLGFANPRSAYMQKRRMMMKFGARGTEPGNFTWPRGIAVGPDDSIVVADSSNHRVQVFDSLGVFLCEFGSYGSCEGQFDCLAGVAVNRIGQYIVSDRYNQRVQLFDPSGRFLRAFGSEGRTDGRFNYPWGITTDSLGFIYVCDKENHRIQVFQSDGTFVGKFGSLGSRPGQLEHPHYVAVSNTNRVVVSDSNNHRVQIFDVNGRTLSTFGSEGSGEGQFKFPRGVAVDDQGFIIVGDSGNNRIQIFHPDGTFLKGFGCWGSGDGEFKGLEGVAVTSSGKILVCDRENHRVQVF